MKRVQLTTGLFLAGCLLITAIQLVTDPITCDVKVSSKSSSPPCPIMHECTGRGGRDLQRVLLDPRHLHAAHLAQG